MTIITLDFSGYPDRRLSVCNGLCKGTAAIHLDETPRLPIAERPLQGPLRWRIGEIAIDEGFVSDIDDLHRWISGMFWHRIPRLLYAQFLAERGLHGHAAVYRQLAA